jgi:hypothetical protein
VGIDLQQLQLVHCPGPVGVPVLGAMVDGLPAVMVELVWLGGMSDADKIGCPG